MLVVNADDYAMSPLAAEYLSAFREWLPPPPLVNTPGAAARCSSRAVLGPVWGHTGPRLAG